MGILNLVLGLVHCPHCGASPTTEEFAARKQQGIPDSAPIQCAHCHKLFSDPVDLDNPIAPAKMNFKIHGLGKNIRIEFDNRSYYCVVTLLISIAWLAFCFFFTTIAFRDGITISGKSVQELWFTCAFLLLFWGFGSSLFWFSLRKIFNTDYVTIQNAKVTLYSKPIPLAKSIQFPVSEVRDIVVTEVFARSNNQQVYVVEIQRSSAKPIAIFDTNHRYEANYLRKVLKDAISNG